MGRYQRKRTPSYGNGAHVIAVKKLDGSMMHINEDLIERVEEGADGPSTSSTVGTSSRPTIRPRWSR
jgi:hypothetical protein